MARAIPLTIAIMAVSMIAARPGLAQPPYTPAKNGHPAKPDSSPMLDEVQARLDWVRKAIAAQDNREARDQLKKVRELSERVLKANASSRRAAVAIGIAFYYEGATGDKKAFERSSNWLQKVVNVDPDATAAYRYLANAYARQGKARETIVNANLALTGELDSAGVREMTELRQPYQDQFLAEWYEYGKYYESPSAKLTRVNLQTYQVEVVAQITPQFEHDLAAKGLQALGSSLQPSPDVQTKQYLQKLVDKLLSKSPGGPPFTYTVDVVENSSVNAMAFANGRIFVHTGLIKFCESEAELITVLAHEIAHVYAHHGARALQSNWQKQQIAGTILQAARIDNSNLKEQLITLGATVGLELLARGYSRNEEKEADKYGTHIAFNAGYNPSFMTKFFLRLYEANPKQPFKWLSTHPPTTERIESTATYLEAFPLEQEMQLDSKEFKDLKARLK